jgi:intracellular multiplication protein IcmE
MNDFNDDFDNFEDDNFDDFKSDNSLKEIWNNNPLVKLFVIVAGIILVATAIFIFSGDGDPIESRVTNAPNEREVLGGEISQNYAEVLEEVNDQRLDRAVQTGTSTIPLLINPEEQDLLTSTEDLPPYQDFDPLEAFRANAVTEPQTVEEEPVLVAPEEVFLPQAQPIPSPSPEAVQALAQAMAGAAGGVVGNHSPQPAQIMQIAPKNYYEQLAAAEAANNAALVDSNGDGIPDTPFSIGDDFGLGGDDIIVETILIPAGEINYAQLLIEANSDIPGPIMAQLVSGPLKGARLIGSFSTAQEHLVLNFNSIVIDGLNQPIQAVAIDPNTTLPGVATEVDKRYFSRVLLPAAARFLEGVGSAIAEDTETTVTVSGDTVIEQQNALDFEQEIGRGVEEAFTEIADFMDEESDDIQPLIRVARGTPIGIFFVEPVLEIQ